MITILKTAVETNETTEVEEIEKGCWVLLKDPTDAEIERVAEEGNFTADFLKAALDKEESSRLEIEGEQILVILDIPIMEVVGTIASYSTVPLGIVLNEEYIVTVSLEENNIIDDFIEQKIKTFYTYKKSRFILQIL
ncbi:MAG TPA: CorA family divalent cation transporter, partial [Candidatus Humimicrobiaceae bacterium]